MKNIIHSIKELPRRKKLQLITAVLLTAAVMVSLPVYAWFTNQKKAAEMYKIEYPNSLYINAAHREDRMYFDLDELDMEEYIKGDDGLPINYNPDTDGSPEYRTKTHRLYAFSVSGEGTTKFLLQLAHTNNNELTYKIYEAEQTGTKPDTGFENYDWVHYERHENGNTENTMTFSDDLAGTDAYYTFVVDGTDKKEVNGVNKNPDGTNPVLAKKDTGDKYYKDTYGTNTNVEAHAVPTYWQATVTLKRSDIDSNTKQFHKYYILEVSWDDTQENTKETDLIYLAVKRAS